MKLKKLILNIPINFNFLIIKNKYILNKSKNKIIIYDNNILFRLFLENNLKLNNNLNYFEYNNKYLNKFFYIQNNFLYKFLKKFNKYFFFKIKFKGKGYKLRFYKKKIIFYFGKSHKSIVIYKNTMLKKILKNKYKFLLLNNNITNLKKICNITINIKKINNFTNRGLRLNKQIIIKRKGRKGSFI